MGVVYHRYRFQMIGIIGRYISSDMTVVSARLSGQSIPWGCLVRHGRSGGQGWMVESTVVGYRF